MLEAVILGKSSPGKTNTVDGCWWLIFGVNICGPFWSRYTTASFSSYANQLHTTFRSVCVGLILHHQHQLDTLGWWFQSWQRRDRRSFTWDDMINIDHWNHWTLEIKGIQLTSIDHLTFIVRWLWMTYGWLMTWSMWMTTLTEGKNVSLPPQCEPPQAMGHLPGLPCGRTGAGASIPGMGQIIWESDGKWC